MGHWTTSVPTREDPLGEGSIENGLLRCPWHGWDYDPITGKAPGFDDAAETFPVEIREDGIYVGLPQEQTHINTVGDLMMETMTNWGVKQVCLANCYSSGNRQLE